MRVLVIFHIFYENLAGYYLEKMRNIHSCQWDLLVTGNGLSETLRQEIRKLKDDAVFMECPNVGYDVWPFIQAVKDTDPNKYDIIIKLHTKNEDSREFSLHGIVMDGAEWKKRMVDALLKDEKAFGMLLEDFVRNPKLGIAYSQDLNFKSKGGNPEDGSMLKSELDRLSIERKSDMFCAGTMFAVRGAALEFLKREDISQDLFHQSGPSHGSSSMAHVYERLIPIAVVSSGYKLRLIPSSRLSAAKFALKAAIEPAIQWLVSVGYFGDDHNKGLKLFGHLFKLPK